MNIVHRLIWNERSQSWVAVSEITGSRRKGRGLTSRLVSATALIVSGIGSGFVNAEPVATTVIPEGGTTRAYISANGVPVINIETANSRGLSHNRFSRYDVETNGLVLNNGNSTQISRSSQLAGQVAANVNLIREASVILNEVVSTRRSALQGYTEVLGGRADVIVANPNGITCSGCGFINTNRVTLTTGRSKIGDDGAVTGFDVNRGDVLINGTGANVNEQQVFDIVARSTRIDGAITGSDQTSIRIATGANVWRYDDRSVTGTTAEPADAPSFAVDSTVLGGMYAGRINIIATEAGVGVRMLGDAAASTNDFTLTSAGRIEIESTISAAQDIQIRTTSATGSQDLALRAPSKVSATRDLTLTVASGNVDMNGGALFAGHDVDLSAASLNDAGQSSDTRYAGNNNRLVVAGATAIRETSWGAGQDLSGAFGELTVAEQGASLYAGKRLTLNTGGDMALAQAAVRADADVDLTAQTGAISTSAGVNQGIQSVDGDIAITAANGLINQGVITADGGNLTGRIDASIVNQGTIHTSGTLDLSDRSDGGSAAISNSGQILSDGTLSVRASQLDNEPGARISSANTLTARVDGALTNHGEIRTNGAIELTNNAGGANTVISNTGKILSDDSLSLRTVSLSNLGSAEIFSSSNISARVDDTVTNQGLIHTTGTIDLRNNNNGVTSTLTNQGSIQSGASSTLRANNLTNDANATISSTTALYAQVGNALSNQGTLHAGGTLTVAGVSGNGSASLTNDGDILSAESMSIRATNLTNGANAKIGSAKALLAQVDNALRNQGTLHADDSVTLSGDTGTASATLTNNGDILSGGSLSIRSTDLTNHANIASVAALTTQVSGTFNNQGTLHAGGALIAEGEPNSASTVLTNGGDILSGGSLQIRAGNVTNQANAQINSGDTLVTRVSGTLDNQAQIQSTSWMDIANDLGVAGGNVNNNGTIQSGDSIAIRSITLTNQDGGLLTSDNSFVADLVALNQLGTSSRIIGATSGNGSVDLTLANAYTNTSVVHSGNSLNLTAPQITNSGTAGLSALNALSLTANSGNLTNQGAIYGAQQVNLNTTGTLHNVGQRHSAQGTIDSGGGLSINAATMLNQSTIKAAGNATITASTFRNDVAGGDDRAWITGSNFQSSSYTTNGYSFPNDAFTEHFTQTWTDYQYYSTSKPTFKPQIIAGSTTTIAGFNTGTNIGGVISGGTVVINGNGGGASFLNDNLSLIARDYTHTYQLYTQYIALGPAKYHDRELQNDNTSNTTRTIDGLGSVGLFASTLNASGFSLTNAGSPYGSSPNSPNAPNAPNASSSPTTPVAAGVPNTPNAVNAPNNANATFAGLNITLPSNPNGLFLVSPDPESGYLIESNPLFNVGSDFQGTDYMAERYGYNPENYIRRLGDANYEAHLVRQQLVQQIGNNLLAGFQNEAKQLRQLMDNALVQGSERGFTYGKALSPDQIDSLDTDIVWMVETTVAGQTVLAPVVYLSKATRDALADGPVIAANTTNLDLESLSNEGGTISGGKSLTITAKYDITNTSGTIKGGDVSLKSTEGSIVNQTLAESSGDDGNVQTTIGKQAGIQASGDLSLDTAKNIENRGAQIAANGNAELTAGNDITFDTVEKKSAESSHRGFLQGAAIGQSETTTKTVEQVKSGLTVGGNLTAKAGRDITLAGTSANIDGDANIDAGRDLNIVARENTVETETTSTVTGFGVGGGLFGTQDKVVNRFSSRNVGSELNIGGNADLSAGEKLALQGSKLTIDGDANIAATDVEVLAGKDIDRTSTTTTTTSFLSIEPQSGTESTSNDAPDVTTGNADESDAAVSARVSTGVADSVGVAASQSASAGVTLAKTNITKTTSLSQRSVGSELDVGGNLTLKAKKDVNLQGSTVAAAGDVDVEAENVTLLAAKNIEHSTSESTTTSLGLYATTENKASAQAQYDASATAGAQADAAHDGLKGGASASADASATAGASASAEASSNSTVDVLRVQKDTRDSLDIRHTGSTISSGGKLKIDAKDTLRTVGSTIVADGDVDVQADNMRFEAAQDISTRKSSSSTTTLGLYADAGAEAKADARADAGANAQASASHSGIAGAADAEASVGAKAGAKAGADAKAGIGIQAKNVTTTNESGSRTAVVSAIKSTSGSVSRRAKSSIRDTGTTIAAATDFNQSAETIEMMAARNEQYATSTTEETTARIGVYAQADAGAEASAGAEAKAGANGGLTGADGEASATASAKAGAGAEAKVGIETSVDRSTETTIDRASQAVVSNVTVGGSVNSRSKGKTVLEGTAINSAGDINLSAKELAVLAARDTEFSSVTTEDIATRAAVTVGAKAEASASAKAGSEGGGNKTKTEVGVAVGVELSAQYDRAKQGAASTTAVVSQLASGGKLNITTEEKTSLEGTQIVAESGVDIDAGSLDFKAAKNTHSSSDSSLSVGGELRAKVGIGSDNSLALSAEMETAQSQASGTEAVVGGISSGADINIRTRDDLRLEGTQIASAGDSDLSAGGNVTVDAARNTEQSSGLSVNAAAGFDSSESSFNASGGYSKESASSSEAVTAGIKSGGALNITAGNNATFEGSELEAAGDAQLVAGNDIAFNEARNESQSESSGVQIGIGMNAKTKNKDGTTTESTGMSASADVSYARASSSEAVTGSIKSGNNLTIASGRDASFVGTTIEADNSAQISAGRDAKFVAAKSRSESIDVGVSASIGGETSTSRKTKTADSSGTASDEATTTESSSEGGLSVDLGYAKSTAEQGSKITAGSGGLTISAGRNVELQGTQAQTSGRATIEAGEKVTQTAATSSSVGVGIGFDVNTESSSESESGGDANSAATDAESPSETARTDVAVKNEDASDENQAPLQTANASDSLDADEAPDLEAESSEETESSGSLRDGTLAFIKEMQQTDIKAAAGSSITAGRPPATSIPGVAMMLRAVKSASGKLKTYLPIPSSLPKGTKVAALLPNGKPLPDWVKFDAAKGTLSGKPPPGSKTDLNIVVSIPQKDGSSKKVGVQFN